MKILYLTIALMILIGTSEAITDTVIEESTPALEEEYMDIEVFQEETPGREMYPYFSVGGRTWFSHMYNDNEHQGALYMYGGEINIDITEQIGIGGTLMVGKDHLSQGHRDVERMDLDVAIKYQFCRYLTGYLDFKRIDYEYELAGDIPGTIVTYKEVLNGIGFGLASAVPIYDTGIFIYLGGGFIPFINFANFDPLDSQVEKEVDYLYNAEGGIGYFLPTRYFDLMATVGYRLQAQRMTEHFGFIGTTENSKSDQPPPPAPKRITRHTNVVQQGIICGLRINW
jgi:hypothetical protein